MNQTPANFASMSPPLCGGWTSAKRRANGKPRRGFSFAEVMFAVVILGIGFIMVAAIFPVAIQQTQSNSEQAVGSAFARDAANLMTQINTYSNTEYYNLPPTTTTGYPAYVLPFDYTPSTVLNTPPMAAPCLHGNYAAISSSLIDVADPRVAFVPLYLRTSTGSAAQIYLINVQVRNRTQYDSTDAPSSYIAATYSPPTLVPKLVKAMITPGTPSTVKFSNGTTTATNSPTTWAGLNTPQPGLNIAQPQPVYTYNATSAVGTGAYFIVGSDSGDGAYNGKVYRVGNQRLDLDSTGNTWELLPGEDFTKIPNEALSGTPWDVWMVGRGKDPSAPAGSNYTGAVQDTGLFSTYVAPQ